MTLDIQPNKIYHSDALTFVRQLADESINSVVTSPPYYGLRDYDTAIWDGGDPNCEHISLGGHGNTAISNSPKQSSASLLTHVGSVCRRCGARRTDAQLGGEESPAEYIDKLVEIFRECRRALRTDGTFWLNLGDSYFNYRPSPDDAARARNYNKDRNGTARGTPSKNKKRNRRLDGFKEKDLMMIPARVALALHADGWYLRSQVVWHKPNPMPYPAEDRLAQSHEMIYLFAKNESPQFWTHRKRPYLDGFRNQRTKPKPEYVWVHRDTGEEFAAPPSDWKKDRYKRINQWTARDYFFDFNAIKEPLHGNGKGGNFSKAYAAAQPRHGGESKRKEYETRFKRDVWTIPVSNFEGGHYATFPEDLIVPIILAGCPEGGIVLDPFFGVGTTALVAQQHRRDWLGCEINADYIEMATARLDGAWSEYQAAKAGKPTTIRMFGE